MKSLSSDNSVEEVEDMTTDFMKTHWSISLVLIGELGRGASWGCKMSTTNSLIAVLNTRLPQIWVGSFKIMETCSEFESLLIPKISGVPNWMAL